MMMAPPGGSSISPSVICQLESALQAVPPPLIARAIAANNATHKLGEHLAARDATTAVDGASAIRALGPGCIDELQPYLDASPDLPAEEAAIVKDFLSIITNLLRFLFLLNIWQDIK